MPAAVNHEDEILFKVVNMQTGIADQARKMGRLRPASAALDRGFKEGQLRAKAGQPAGLLACATVRLQSCALLSSFQKHPEALEEACAAVLEMDKLWKDLTMANGVAQAAARDHRCVSDTLKHSKVPPGLQELMLRPPKWLDQAVTVSVEAKHCVALELEYCLLAQEPIDLSGSFPGRPGSAAGLRKKVSKQGRPQSAPMTAGNAGAKVGSAVANVCGDDDVTWALSVASAGVQHLKDPWGLIERLHSEGLAMAELLLTEGHPALERSRRTEWQARGRNPCVANRVAEQEQDAAEKAAEEARRLAAVEAERRAAEEAARKAAEEEAARKAAEEGARVAVLFHPKTALADERAEQIVEHREKVEVGRKTAAFKSPRTPVRSPRREEAELDTLPATTRTRSEPQESAGARNMRMFIPEETPPPTKQEVAADFLRDALGNSAAGANLRRIRRDSEQRETFVSLSPRTPQPERQTSAASSAYALPPPTEKRPGSAPAPGRARRGSGGQLRVPGDRGVDLFKEFKAEQCSWNQLTYFQKKMTSEAGIDDMRHYIKKEGHRFVHGYLKGVSPEVLYENRVHFNPSMVAYHRRQQGRYGLSDGANAAAAVQTASTNDLKRAMRRTWQSLYGFRDKDENEKRKKTVAKDFGAIFSQGKSAGH